MHKFALIPVAPQTAPPDTFIVHALGNFSQLFGPRLIPDQILHIGVAIANVSTLGALTFTTTDPIELPSITNVSTLDTLTVSEAPADGTIRLPSIANSSTLETFSVDIAPPDGVIRMPSITNVSMLDTLTVTATGGPAEDYDAVVAYPPVATEPA